MQQDLTQGSIRAGLIRFSLPLIAGNLLQQLYNIADTLIVGRFLGNVALAAVGSAFSLMILLTSLILGLCMGSGVVFSQLYGEGNTEKLKTAMTNAFCLIAALSLLLMALSYALLNAFISLLRVPQEAVPDITSYLLVIFAGIFFTFLYNFFAAVLRSVGNSFAPLLFLLLSTVVNIALDLLFVIVFHWGFPARRWQRSSRRCFPRRVLCSTLRSASLPFGRAGQPFGWIVRCWAALRASAC